MNLWLRLLWTLVSAKFRGWLTSTPLHRSLSAAATPPADPCQDPFGDNVNQKTLVFNQALADLKWAVQAYLNCRQSHGLANTTIEAVNQKFASIETTRDEILEMIS